MAVVVVLAATAHYYAPKLKSGSYGGVLSLSQIPSGVFKGTMRLADENHSESGSAVLVNKDSVIFIMTTEYPTRLVHLKGLMANNEVVRVEIDGDEVTSMEKMRMPTIELSNLSPTQNSLINKEFDRIDLILAIILHFYNSTEERWVREVYVPEMDNPPKTVA